MTSSKDDLREVLHLYLGCDGFLPDDNGNYTCEAKLAPSILGGTYYGPDQFKLCLRPLSSMTEEEASECFHKVMGGSYAVINPKHALTTSGFFPSTHVTQMASGVKYLLSKGFDLFGLLEKGLAIEKKTD